MLISWNVLAGSELRFGPGLEAGCKQLLCQLSKVFVPFPTLVSCRWELWTLPQAEVSWQAKLWQWLGVGPSRGGQPGPGHWCSLVQ